MAFGLKPQQADPLVDVKRELIDALRDFVGAAAHTDAAANAQSRAAEAQKKLSESGQGEFAGRARSRAETMDKFFGEYGATNRGKTLATIRQAPNIFGNAMSALQEDFFGTITGTDKKNSEKGLKKNSFLSRALGAEKFFLSEDQQQEKEEPVIDKHAVAILEKVEKNTEATARALGAVTDANKTSDALSHVLKTPQAPTVAAINTNKKGVLTDTVEKAVDGFTETVFGTASGSVIGGAIKSAMPKILAKAPIAAAAISIIGSLIWAGVDGVSGYFKSGSWGTSKTSGVVGAALAGTDKGLLSALGGAGKWALAGATIGSAFPVVGTLAGGIIGAAVGGIVGWFGGEQIAKLIDSAAAAVGRWSDKILGTAFQLDPKQLKQSLANLKLEAEDREKRIALDLVFVTAIDKQITEARVNGNKAEIDTLIKRRDAILVRLKQDEKESEEFDAEIERTTNDLSDAKKSLLGRTWDVIRERAVKPLASIADVVFGSSLALNENDTKSAVNDVEKKLSKLKDSIQEIDGKLTNLLDARANAVSAGDFALVKAIDIRVRSLKEKKSKLVEDQKSAQFDLERAVEDLFMATHKLPQMIADGFSSAAKWLSDQKIGDKILDFAKAASDWITKIFSWKYWFGDGSKFSDAKDAVGRAKAIEERRGKMLASMEDTNKHLIGKNDPRIDSAITAYKRGDIDESALKDRLKSVEDYSDDRSKSDAGKIRSELDGYERFKSDLGPATIGAKEPPRESMTETNYKEDESRRAERAAETKSAAATIATVVNNNTTVNNSGVYFPVSPTNDERSFAAGALGTRVIAYGD